MNRELFGHVLESQRAKLALVAVALTIWGTLMPLIFESFKPEIQFFLGSGQIPQQFTQFGGGDLFSLPGAVALGFIHPIAVALVLVFGIGYAVVALAGERQRGTLEVLLARPISRRSAYLTCLVALALFVAVSIAAHVAGTVIGSTLTGAEGELQPDRLLMMWLNGVLVFGAFGAVSLAASASFDRLTPALGVSLAFFLVSYTMEILGSLWPSAHGLQPWSLFHYLDPKGALTGALTAGDWWVPIGVLAVSIAVALYVFPRRDLAAPS